MHNIVAGNVNPKPARGNDVAQGVGKNSLPLPPLFREKLSPRVY